MSDAYWTEARRADPRALPFEPYCGHQVMEYQRYEFGTFVCYLYVVVGHSEEWSTPIEARAAVDRCVAAGECVAGRREREKGDPFARFGGPLYG